MPMSHRTSVFAACLLLYACSSTPSPAADLSSGVDQASRVPKKHRATAAACPMTRPPGPDPGAGRGTCTKDSDCNDASQGANGRCVFSRAGAGCSYDTCFDDARCSSKVCLCRPAGEAVATLQANHCLSEGNCQTDRDCGAAGYCSPSFSFCGNYSGVVSYYCHTAADACVDDEDCRGVDGGIDGYCMFNPAATRWICSYSQCAG